MPKNDRYEDDELETNVEEFETDEPDTDDYSDDLDSDVDEDLDGEDYDDEDDADDQAYSGDDEDDDTDTPEDYDDEDDDTDEWDEDPDEWDEDSDEWDDDDEDDDWDYGGDWDDDEDDDLEEYDLDADDEDDPQQSLEDADDADKDEIIRRLRAESAARRKKNKDLQAGMESVIEEGLLGVMEDLANNLGIESEELDLDGISDAFKGQIAQAQQARNQAVTELALYKAAHRLGANPSRLSDSKRFTDAIAELDPTADSYGTDVENAIKAAMKSDRSFKETPRVERSGGDFQQNNPAMADMSMESLIKARRQRRGVDD